MDWSQEEAGSPAKEESVLLPPASAELQELSFSLLPSLNNSGRRLGRKISHKKSASDTFAFAAGQDFLALLSEKPPLEPVGHARHASSGAGLAGSPSADTDQQMTTDAAQEAGSLGLARPCEPQSSADAAAAAAALGRAGAMFASDPGTAAAADLGTAAAAAAAAAADSAEAEAGGTQTRGNALDTTQLDPRKAKRILANRQSAQRSRMKRLQYINELEGRKDKAEAGVRELRSKVVKAQRQQTGLAQQVEEKKEELSALQQQLVYEQSVQASLGSYIQALQLQMQQQQQSQHWGSSQLQNGYQVQQALTQPGAADVYCQGQNGSYSYDAATAQSVSQQYMGQQALPHLPMCNGLLEDSKAPMQQQQQQQQWPQYRHGPLGDQQQLEVGQHQQQHSQLHQQQGYGYTYDQAMQLQQQYADGQHMQQQRTHGLHPAAAAAAAVVVASSAHMHRRSLSGASAASAHAPGITTGAAGAGAHRREHQQQSALLQPGVKAPGAAATAAAAGAYSSALGSAPTGVAAAAAAGSDAGRPAHAAAALSTPSVATGQTDSIAVVRNSSVSQGSGSVLLHGSISDAELDSILGLSATLTPGLGAEQLTPGGVRDIQQLLGTTESGLLLPPDDLL